MKSPGFFKPYSCSTSGPVRHTFFSLCLPTSLPPCVSSICLFRKSRGKARAQGMRRDCVRMMPHWQTNGRTYLPDCSPSHVPSTFLSKESMSSSQPWCRHAYHQKSHTWIVLSLAVISKFVVLLHPQIYWHDNSAGELKCKIVVSDGRT
jgi:hypothetical protein